MKPIGTYCSILLLLCQGLLFSRSVPEKWLTYYEKSGFKKTPRYQETIQYCRMLEKGSPWIRATSFGKSAEGRDLPLVIASKEGAFSPSKAHRTGKAVILIQNGIHAGEIDGKDACLMLLRDIAITKTKARLLDSVILLVVPIYNVDGHERFSPYNRINQNGPEEMGWRVTAQNLNLNRDYMKADAPETRAWLAMFSLWLPDFFIDCHVTDGADYQFVVTYGMESHQFVSPPLRSWIREKYLPQLSSVVTGGVPFARYIELIDPADPMKGIGGGVAPPRFSHDYIYQQNRPGLLIETHMLKEYKKRVDGTYRLIESTLEILNKECASLHLAVRTADDEAAKGLPSPFPLSFATVDTPNGTFHYMGFRQKNEKSDVSGGTWTNYGKEPFEADIPLYDSVRALVTVELPAAYLIPMQWGEVISRLGLHGVKIERLKKPVKLNIESYRFRNASWHQQPFEGRHMVEYGVDKFTQVKLFPEGTALVRLNQRAARIAVHALEPEGPDSYAAWGFFDGVFEQKEYFEGYVMEKMAREMLAQDPALKKEFESRLASDTSFAKSPRSRLNFFYQRSPYRDDQMNVYPVSRLMDIKELDK